MILCSMSLDTQKLLQRVERSWSMFKIPKEDSETPDPRVFKFIALLSPQFTFNLGQTHLLLCLLAKVTD